MVDNVTEEYFVDLVSNMSHANGVFRITLGQQEADNTVRPVVKLLIPANQLEIMLKGIADAAREIGEKVRTQAKDASSPPKDDDAKKKDKS